MNLLTCLSATVLTVTPTPAFAQDRAPEAPTIVVTGEGTGEALPNVFTINALVQGRGETQAAALRQLATVQSRLLDQWPQLDGLTEARATTGDISIEPRREPECESNARRNDTCPIVDYVAHSSVTLRGAPANRSGDAVALASDLGAVRAALDEYVLADRQALRAQANRAAFEDARRQAALLVEASGRRLGRIVRIQDPSAARYDAADGATQIGEIVVTGNRVRPAVSIEAAPEPVRVNARITVVFEIE